MRQDGLDVRRISRVCASDMHVPPLSHSQCEGRKAKIRDKLSLLCVCSFTRAFLSMKLVNFTVTGDFF